MAAVGASRSRRGAGGPGFILIATNPKDADSFLVQEALRRKGFHAELAHLSDFPSRAKASLHLGAGAEDDRWSLFDRPDRSLPLLPDTVWWRRPERPVLPADVHPEDKDFIRQETARFLTGLWYHLPRQTVFINPPAQAAVADRKPHQLRVARDMGFTVPPTLFSNDPAEIRAALRAWGGRAVYKSFGSVHNYWLDAERQKVLTLFTTAIDESSLPEDDVLALTPGIYQPLIPKAFELRVTAFGSTVFATKILSQEQERSRVDWRNGQRTLRYEPIDPWPCLRNLCLAMLARLGLLMGCFDFVVTPEEELVFLEVNEGGQFLWLETASGVPLLDAFSDFLLDPRPAFRWRPSPEPLRIEDVQAAAAERMAEAAEVHLMPETAAYTAG